MRLTVIPFEFSARRMVLEKTGEIGNQMKDQDPS